MNGFGEVQEIGLVQSLEGLLLDVSLQISTMNVYVCFSEPNVVQLLLFFFFLNFLLRSHRSPLLTKLWEPGLVASSSISSRQSTREECLPH